MIRADTNHWVNICIQFATCNIYPMEPNAQYSNSCFPLIDIETGHASDCSYPAKIQKG